MDKYDSYEDTRKHINRVQDLLDQFADDLDIRGQLHDQSKLEEPEKSVFDEMTPILKGLKYGTDEYTKSLEKVKPALEHHYKNNSHHPEYYENGINDMNLADIVEMYCDWKAAGERTKDGDIHKSIDFNKTRFEMSDQLAQIFHNTANYFGHGRNS